jgi:hypothetical protein
MDVPLAINDIGIRQGLMDKKRKSSTFCRKTNVVGLFELYIMPLGVFKNQTL